MRTPGVGIGCLLLFGAAALVGCDRGGCSEGDLLECDCGLGYTGDEVCQEDDTWGECECDPCVQFVVSVCTCDGVDEFYESFGSTCQETYQLLIDLGNVYACEVANDAYETLGGCDQFSLVGDDDDDDSA